MKPSTVLSNPPPEDEFHGKMTDFHLYLYGPRGGSIETTFEQAAERLQRLPRLCFEPDGSFVWVGDKEQELFGMLYDAGGSIQYCEIRGQCDLDAWKLLCHAITGNPVCDLTLMLLPLQQLQDLQTFERRFGSDGESLDA